MDTADIIKRIRKIEIRTRKLVNEVFAGEYHSLFKGQGLEFSETREYQWGDSFRLIDWKVTARTGKPHIKRFEETRELSVIFLVDVSASTIFGTRGLLKSEFITEVTGVLSFSAISNNDKVGLMLFSDEVEKYIPPRKGRKYALRILRDILWWEPQAKKTNIAGAVEAIYRLIKKKSIIFVISDFLDDQYEDQLKILSRKHDVIALQVTDPAEEELPDIGLVHLTDPETGELLSVNTSSGAVREKYRRAIRSKMAGVSGQMKRIKVDLVQLRTNQPYSHELMKFFKKRMREKRRR